MAAVPAVVAGQRVVALEVAALVPDLADVAVGQDEAVAQGGVAHLEHLQIPGDVIVSEGLGQLPVLEVDLLTAHRGVLMVVIMEVDHTVAHHLWPAEPRELVVAGNDLRVVTQRLPTQGRLQTRVQQEAVGTAEFHLGDVAVLHGGPGVLHVVPVLLEEELR